MKRAIIAAAALMVCISGFCEVKSSKHMTVRKMDIDIEDMTAIDKALESVEYQLIDCNDWPHIYTYNPDVKFKMFHTGANMVIRYYVTEDCTGATYTNDGDGVSRDSCVEFFISPNRDREYYNFEANCIGTMLINHQLTPGCHGKDVTPEVYNMVKRYPSLGREPFAERNELNSWTITFVVPIKALYASSLESWDGLDCTMNFYKCSHRLSKKVSLSWSKIVYERSRFHLPAYFGRVYFEK